MKSHRSYTAVMAVALAVSTEDRLAGNVAATESRVPVCMEKGGHEPTAVKQAQTMAAGLFASIGIAIEWRDLYRRCEPRRTSLSSCTCRCTRTIRSSLGRWLTRCPSRAGTSACFTTACSRPTAAESRTCSRTHWFTRLHTFCRGAIIIPIRAS